MMPLSVLTARLPGDPTEVALLHAAHAAGVVREAAEREAPRIAEIPFDSEKKCMTTVHRLADGTVISITKGAAEVVLRGCVSETRLDGERPIDTTHLLHIADEMAMDGQRVPAVAMRRWHVVPEQIDAGIEQELSFLGLLGLIDPPRAEAQQAIAVCKRIE